MFFVVGTSKLTSFFFLFYRFYLPFLPILFTKNFGFIFSDFLRFKITDYKELVQLEIEGEHFAYVSQRLESGVRKSKMTHLN